MLGALVNLATHAGPNYTVGMSPVRITGRKVETACVVTTPSRE